MSAKVTENDVYRLLRARICKDSGNGPQAVLVPQVRSAAGFDSRRTIDAISLGLWPSRGMLLEGYEIKVSRSDWLRELKDPAKAEVFAERVDRLWVVAGDSSIVADGELPQGWGLLVKHGSQLRQAVAAAPLREGKDLPPGFDRSFLVPMLRAANIVPPEVREELRVEAESRAEHTLARLREDLGRLTAQVDAFQEAAGVEITSYRLSSTPEDVARRGAAFKVALEGEDSIERLRQSARWIARSAERLVEQAREIADPPSSEADAA